MAVIQFHFTKPRSWVGRVIKWRTGDTYSHSWVVVDDVMYNPLPLWSKKHDADWDKGDVVAYLTVTDAQEEAIKVFCEDWVGTTYDFLGIFGWLIGVKEIQHPNHTYCHEFCHKIMSMVTGKGSSHKLISAKHLLDELSGMDVVFVVND